MFSNMKNQEKEFCFRVGLIGLGYAGFVQLPALKRLENCKVVAVCGTSLEKTRDFALQNDIPEAFADWEQMLTKAQLDLLVLAVPPVTQTIILKTALAMGIRCFCEKPLSSDLWSAEELLQLANKNADFQAVDFIFPEIPCWLRAKEKIVSGAIGEIKHASVNWFVQTEASRKGSHAWKLDRKSGGGVLKNFVSHVLYNVEWMLGNIRSVSCLLDEIAPGSDVGAWIRLQLGSGTIVTVNVNQDALAGTGHDFSIYGKLGTIHLSNPGKDYVKGFKGTYVNSGGVSETLDSESDFRENTDARIAVVSSLLSRWQKCLRTGTPMKPNLADGVRVQILLQALETANSEKVISLEI